MSRTEWSLETSHWSLIPPQVANDLRVFPIAIEDGVLVLITDRLPIDDDKRAAFEQMVRNNLCGRQLRLASSEDYVEAEFNFGELLDHFYNVNGMPQVVSAPVTRNLGTVILLDPDRKRAKKFRQDFSERGYEVKCAGSVEKGLKIIKSLKGIVKTVFIAPDIPQGFENAAHEINSHYDGIKCEARGHGVPVARAMVVPEPA